MSRSKRVALGALVFLVMRSASLPACADDRPTAEVMRALRPDHPRLYVLDQEIDVIKQQIKVDARLRRWYDRLQKDAERMIREPVVVHRLIGPRLLDQSRAALRRISTLAGLYRLDGDYRKADRARQEMLAAAEFPDWNPAHFLDVAEMTNALAIGYDWLYQFLTDADRARIRQAIVEKGLKPGLLVYESGLGWPMVIHNWNQVCNGGLTAGALAVADRQPDLARQVVDHARRSIVRVMTSFAPDGGWAEGPGYWNYATEYNVFFLSAVESALGTDFGLKRMAGFRETGEFRIQSIGPLNRTFNYADAHDSPGAAPQMFWFAKAFSRPDYAEHESRYIGDRAGIFHLLWAAGLPAALPDSAQPLDKLFRGIDVAFFRSAWNDKDAIFVGFKGGDNTANHSHLDLGTFVLDALGQRWALDLGSDDYNLPGYFGQQRWNYYRLRTEGHNTLTIEGENQDPEARARLLAFHSDSERALAVADLTEAYAPHVRRAWRGIALLDRRHVLIQDEIEANRSVEVIWNFHTRAQIEIHGGRALLSADSSRIELQIVAPHGAHFETISANPRPPQGQQPDVANLIIRVPGTRNARLAVGITRASNEVVPGLGPLSQWVSRGRLPRQ